MNKMKKLLLPGLFVALLLGTPAQSQTPPAAAPTPAPAAEAGKVSFTIMGSDDSADVTKIAVKKGDVVSITFKVDPNNTYHGGLKFVSDDIDTGAIAPGESKTVTFTAKSSFEFVPYWPRNNRRKPYVVTVTVQ